MWWLVHRGLHPPRRCGFRRGLPYSEPWRSPRDLRQRRRPGARPVGPRVARLSRPVVDARSMKRWSGAWKNCSPLPSSLNGAPYAEAMADWMPGKARTDAIRAVTVLGVYTGLHDEISVQDFGISNATVADGLAVGRPSGFVGRAMQRLVDGYLTVIENPVHALEPQEQHEVDELQQGDMGPRFGLQPGEDLEHLLATPGLVVEAVRAPAHPRGAASHPVHAEGRHRRGAGMGRGRRSLAARRLRPDDRQRGARAVSLVPEYVRYRGKIDRDKDFYTYSGPLTGS